MRNAIELIGEANHGPFKAEYRDQALALLAEVPRPTRCATPWSPSPRTSTPRPTRTRPGTAALPTPSPPATSTGPSRLVPPGRDRRLRDLGAGLDRHHHRLRPLLRLRRRRRPRRFPGGLLLPSQLPQLGDAGLHRGLDRVRRPRPRAALRGDAARRLPLAEPGAAGLDLRHPRLHLRRVPVRRRLRARRRRPAAGLYPADGGAGARGAGGASRRGAEVLPPRPVRPAGALRRSPRGSPRSPRRGPPPSPRSACRRRCRGRLP